VNINERTAVLELKEQLERAVPLVDFRVFGSKARDVDSAESDVDVMIEVESYTPEIEAIIDNLVYEINLAHGCLISVLIFGKGELEEGPLRQSPVYRAITEEGIRI
jgi:uncharacterized protein